MRLRDFALLAGLLLGGALVLAWPTAPATASEPCCAIVKFDAKTRVVTVRDSAGQTHQCQVPAGQDPGVMKAGAKVDLDTTVFAKRSAGGATGSMAQACGGWNGPRTAPTKPTGTTTPPPKPK
jgi:hypothetical protein